MRRFPASAHTGRLHQGRCIADCGHNIGAHVHFDKRRNAAILSGRTEGLVRHRCSGANVTAHQEGAFVLAACCRDSLIRVLVAVLPTQMLGQSESTTPNAGNGVAAGGRFPQGRIERMGTLVGWSSPFGTLSPSSYTVRALVQSECLSISRADFRSVLTNFPGDAACFARAAEHAAKTLIPVKTLKSNWGKDGSLRSMGSVRAGAGIGSGSVRDEIRSNDGSEPFRAPCSGASWLPPSASTDTASSADVGGNEQDGGCRTRTDTEAGSGVAEVTGGGKDESLAELRSQMDAGFSRLNEQQEKLASDLASLKQLIVALAPS